MQIKNNPKVVFKVTAHQTDNENLVSHSSGTTKSHAQSRSMFPIIMGIVTAFIIVAAISAASVVFSFIESTSNDEAIVLEIPDLQGSIYSEELKRQLESNYYEVKIKDVFDSVSSANTIIEQDPAPGEKRKVIPGEQSCELSITVSKGARTFTLDDYKYLYYYEAEIALKNLGLIPERQYVYHDYIPESYVVSSEPEAGETVKYGDKIVITISKGQNSEDYMVTVPDFTEGTENAAKLLLLENNLKLGKVEYIESSEEKGKILSQSVASMSTVPVGTEISFKVSRGNGKTTSANNRHNNVKSNLFDDIGLN